MKAIVFTLLLIFSSANFVSEELNGQWSGALNVQGMQLRIVFNIKNSGDKYEATMDSPDQNVNGIPVSLVNQSDAVIRLEISTIGIVYEGTLSGNTITGTWKQSGQTFPLILSKDKN